MNIGVTNLKAQIISEVFLHYNNQKTKGSKNNLFDGRKHLGLLLGGKIRRAIRILNINMALEDKVNEILGLEPVKGTNLKKKSFSTA